MTTYGANSGHFTRSRAFLFLALLSCFSVPPVQGTTPILDWQVLLTDPDPEELTHLASPGGCIARPPGSVIFRPSGGLPGCMRMVGAPPGTQISLLPG